MLTTISPIKRWRFNKKSKNFTQIYKDLRGGDIEPFLMDFWKGQNEELEKIFSPKVPFRFLDNQLLRNTMFLTASQKGMKNELPLLEKHFRDRLPALLREDELSGREKMTGRLKSSGNTIHHLYHMAYYEITTGNKVADISSVVEWGGGYGNMAKLFRRINSTCTYSIIDTAFFSALQWLYLSTVLPEGSVNLIRKKSDTLKEGRINIIPLKYLRSHNPKGELFISTWGLSESTAYAQDYVVKQKWFGADKLLIGYQDSTDELSQASRLGNLARASRARIIPIKFIKRNYYALK